MIEKVGYTRPVVRAKKASSTSSASGSGFSDALSDAQSALETNEVATPAQLSSLGGVSLLGFQEVDADQQERRKAYKRGRLTLDALAQLRDALLMGNLPLSTIQRLEQLVASERGLTTDPVLNSVLDEIELRAAVEIAKLEVALSRQP